MPRRSRRQSKDDDLVRSFGERLRELRAAQNLTQEALAEKAGVSAAEVGFIERAEREVGLVMLARLAAGLNVSLASLLETLN